MDSEIVTDASLVCNTVPATAAVLRDTTCGIPYSVIHYEQEYRMEAHNRNLSIQWVSLVVQKMTDPSILNTACW
jgi:hypothetical protein